MQSQKTEDGSYAYQTMMRRTGGDKDKIKEYEKRSRERTIELRAERKGMTVAEYKEKFRP